MADKERRGPDEPGRQAVLERDPKVARPKMYRVVLHNDDYTTMEFVVWILRDVFRLDEGEATHLMLTIHHKGQAVAGVFTRDIAETKAAQVLAYAEAKGMPLMCTTEPDA